jgi:hypothetical protein
MNNESIFRKEDFTLCDAPVPEGYPQSQSHTGIAFIPTKLGGYQYWLVSSPFPNKKQPRLILYFKIKTHRFLSKYFKEVKGSVGKSSPAGEDFENPLLFFANESLDGSPPTSFIPFIGNPLMEKPVDLYGGGTFCSDPDIFVEDNNVYILNRESYRRYYYAETNSYDSFLRINLIKGKIENNVFTIKEIDTKFTDKENAASPCLIKHKDKYHYLYLVTNSYNDGSDCEKLVIRSDNSIEGNFDFRKTVNMDKGKFEPWHLSVFLYNDKLYTIITCILKGKKGRCYQMLGEFDDSLDNVKIYQKPLTNINSYRGSACVNDDGVFVLYSTTVHTKFNGSKSVDGRDIILAKLPFDLLMNKLKK